MKIKNKINLKIILNWEFKRYIYIYIYVCMYIQIIKLIWKGIFKRVNLSKSLKNFEK